MDLSRPFLRESEYFSCKTFRLFCENLMLSHDIISVVIFLFSLSYLCVKSVAFHCRFLFASMHIYNIYSRKRFR